MRKAEELSQKPQPKRSHFIGSARKDIQALPEDVQDVFGKSLSKAEWGGKAGNAVPLKGFKGSDVLEVKDDFEGNTYRCVYTTRFPKAIYVLHIFQKKSTEGIKTAKQDLERIRTRLQTAQ